MNRCSSTDHEPLPGSAKPGNVVVALEYLHGWGRDVLDDDVFGPELAAAVRTHLGKAGLQLIRKPGRAGQHRKRRYCYLAFCQEGVLERLLVDGPEDLLKLDLSGPGRNGHLGAEAIDEPIVLVCTHGKRDMCCALKGRPLAAAMQTCFYGDEVWESSHTKGHRFAPSMIVLPWGYSFGRLNSSAAIDMLKYFNRGELFLPGNRGRGTFDPAGQVAELVVANELIDQGTVVAPGSLVVEKVESDSETIREVIEPSGKSWQVVLEQREVDNVIASCGNEPKTGKVWVPVLIRQR